MPVPGLFVDTTLLLRRRCVATPATGADPAALAVVRIDDDADVLADCRAVGRQAAPERCRQRRQRGLQFYSLRRSGRSLANTWATCGGERFLDEALLVFELGARDACLRDMYVARDERGQGLFAQFVHALERGPLAGIEQLWSCVDRSNEASRAAHLRCGFETVGQVSAVALFDRLLLRRGSVPPGLRCREFEAGRRLLWIDARARAFRLAHLA